MNFPEDMKRCHGEPPEGGTCGRRGNCIRYSQIAKDAELAAEMAARGEKVLTFINAPFLCDEDWRYWLPPRVGK